MNNLRIMSLLAMLVIAATATTATTEPAPLYRNSFDTLAREVAAQDELVLQLSTADSIDRVVVVAGKGIDFTIARAHVAFRVRAVTTGSDVTGVATATLGAAQTATGDYAWLARELRGDVRITGLAVGADGAVTLETDAGLRYALIAGRGANMAVAARWAASWESAAARDTDDDEPAVDVDAVATADD